MNETIERHTQSIEVQRRARYGLGLPGFIDVFWRAFDAGKPAASREGDDGHVHAQVAVGYHVDG